MLRIKPGFLLLAVVWIVLVSLEWMRLPARGLLASYYPTVDWTGAPVFLHREDKIELDTVEHLVKYAGFPAENFSIRWEGWIRIDHDRVYHFGTTSKDGLSLLIDRHLVVDNHGLSMAEVVWGSIFLTKGMHQLTITYFKKDSEDALAVFWKDQQDRPTALPADLLFPKRLSPDLELFSRYFPIIMGVYGLAWGWLGLITVQRSWPALRSGCTLRALPRFGIRLALLIIIGGFFYDNLHGLHAKQPFVYGYLAPKADRKLSSVLPRKGFGDSDAVFIATLRHLYQGATLWLPQDDVFKTSHLLNEGGLRAVQLYSQDLRLTPAEVARLNRHVYHRFVYDPYEFRPDGDQLDRSLRLTFDATRRPVFVFVIQPTPSDQSGAMVAAVPYERDLYVIPFQRLPERLQPYVHE